MSGALGMGAEEGMLDPGASEPMPMVSVVLPTRDRATLLRHAIQSVLNQEYPAVQVVVINDGSTDGTRDLLDTMEAAHANVIALHHPRPRGVAASRNDGIRMSSGELIAFQDDDCVWSPDRLGILVAGLQRAGPDAGFVYGPVLNRDIAGRAWITGAGVAVDRFHGPVQAGTPAVLLRRSTLDVAGVFDERLTRLEDFDLWVRVLAVTDYVFVPRVLVATLRSPTGLSTQVDPLISAARVIGGKYSGSHPVDRRARSAICRILAHQMLMHDVGAEGVRYYANAVRFEPTSIRSWLGLVAALGGPRAYRVASAVRGWAGRIPKRPIAAADDRLHRACDELCAARTRGSMGASERARARSLPAGSTIGSSNRP